MAVVTRGSFSEGPITLALPPYFDSDTAESDPIFEAWDKAVGIVISASQVSDFDTEVGNNTSVVANTAKNTYPAADAAKLALIEANATNVDDSLLVPYTGATGNVALGTYDISVGKVIIADTPNSPTDAATKAYVDSVVSVGMNWIERVIDIIANAAALPGDATTGDRYITIDDNHIREWDGADWDEDITPNEGDTVYVSENGINPTNDIGTHTYNGISWIYVGGSINHNDTSNIQGGTAGNRWHLESEVHTAIGYVATTGADITPTTFNNDDSGIIIGDGGIQSVYVTYSWDAIITNTFHHYNFQYKQHDLTYWEERTTVEDTITIDGLLPNVSYDFRVASVNKYGSYSAYTATDTITTPSDSGAPANVQNVTATQGIQAILLAWDHNTDLDLNSYNIYRYESNDSGSAVLVANYTGNVYRDNGLVKDTEYFYWLKAVDTSGNLSDNFSTVANATTRNVEKEDIKNIAANQVLIQGVTTFASLISPGVATIDGGKITADTVTVDSLNFVPLSAGDGLLTTDIVGTINASAEGIQISGDHIQINGTTDFQPLGAATNGKVWIFPDANTGIRITDNSAHDVFNVQIGGDNQGDVTIGNYAGGEGIKYDCDVGTTTFAGHLLAIGGTIGTWNIEPGYIYTGTKVTGDGYSSGSGHITLKSDGSIHAEHFYINADGTVGLASMNNAHNFPKVVGSVTRHSSVSEVFDEVNWGVLKSVTFTHGLIGEFSAAWEHYKDEVGEVGTAQTRLYKNGVALDVAKTATTNYTTQSTGTISETWEPGDICELRGYTDSGVVIYVKNFYIRYDNGDITTVTASIADDET